MKRTLSVINRRCGSAARKTNSVNKNKLLHSSFAQQRCAHIKVVPTHDQQHRVIFQVRCTIDNLHSLHAAKRTEHSTTRRRTHDYLVALERLVYIKQGLVANSYGVTTLKLNLKWIIVIATTLPLWARGLLSTKLGDRWLRHNECSRSHLPPTRATDVLGHALMETQLATRLGPSKSTYRFTSVHKGERKYISRLTDYERRPLQLLYMRKRKNRLFCHMRG